MTTDKFEKDTRTVHKFIQLYCDNKHKSIDKNTRAIPLRYENENLGEINYNLCEDCEKTLKISCENLLNCPHDEKPSCRKCPAPCYDKTDWKKIAKIMKYSGMQMGLLKIRKLFKRGQG
ncbi:MAG: nitrous oxide-stimulated promoter family protein [Epsilonproteobacteria bacterium]|nr:nitrous oxide-stimulated promoter family protein [Campylobacterota bacterium]